jgi:hypothetical protein
MQKVALFASLPIIKRETRNNLVSLFLFAIVTHTLSNLSRE